MAGTTQKGFKEFWISNDLHTAKMIEPETLSSLFGRTREVNVKVKTSQSMRHRGLVVSKES